MGSRNFHIIFGFFFAGTCDISDPWTWKMFNGSWLKRERLWINYVPVKNIHFVPALYWFSNLVGQYRFFPKFWLPKCEKISLKTKLRAVISDLITDIGIKWRDVSNKRPRYGKVGWSVISWSYIPILSLTTSAICTRVSKPRKMPHSDSAVINGWPFLTLNWDKWTARFDGELKHESCHDMIHLSRNLSSYFSFISSEGQISHCLTCIFTVRTSMFSTLIPLFAINKS